MLLSRGDTGNSADLLGLMSGSRSRWMYLISVVAAVLAGFLVYGVYVLQVNQVELQQTVQVVVPRDFIRAGQFIHNDMVEFRAIQKASYTEGMMTRLADVVGQESMIPLGTQ